VRERFTHGGKGEAARDEWVFIRREFDDVVGGAGRVHARTSFNRGGPADRSGFFSKRGLMRGDMLQGLKDFSSHPIFVDEVADERDFFRVS